MTRLRANGIDLEVQIQGEGEPLVLVMGLGTQLVHWPEGFCALLASRGFRVIRFDNRDVGLSTWLDDGGVPPVRKLVARRLLGLPVMAPYTLRDMADDVAGLIDALDLGAAHVVGISMGGMIAQTLAIHRPQRIRSLVSLMSTTGSRRFIGQRRAVRALLGPMPRSREEAIERSVHVFRALAGPGFGFDEPQVRETASIAYDRAFHPAGFARQLAAVLASGSREKALATVRVPTLVIHGADDPLIPAAAGRATARAIPGAFCEIVPGLGHGLPEGAWRRLVDAIAWHVRYTQALR